MKTITTDLNLDAPASLAWEKLADFGNIADFNPNLSGSFLLEGSAPRGVGAERQCDMTNGRDFIRERVTAWEEGRSYSVDIFEGTMPLKTAHATLTVEPRGLATSHVTMSLTYEPKFGAFGALLDVVMLRRMLLQSCARVLEGLGDEVAAGKSAA